LTEWIKPKDTDGDKAKSKINDELQHKRQNVNIMIVDDERDPCILFQSLLLKDYYNNGNNQNCIDTFSLPAYAVKRFVGVNSRNGNDLHPITRLGKIGCKNAKSTGFNYNKTLK
jgi:hypothetical protein